MNNVKYLPMTLNEYQQRAMTTCLPSCENDCYMLFGLVEEVGELCGKVSKAIRREQIVINDCNINVPHREQEAELNTNIKSELGDVLWMLAGFCRTMGWSLEDVARANLEKLAKRKETDTIIEHKDH